MPTVPDPVGECSRAGIAAMYRAPGAEAARLRAAHLSAVVRLTPQAMVANIGSAALVIAAFSPRLPAGMALWLAALCGACGLALWRWWRLRGRPVQRLAAVSPRSVHRATLHAGVLAGIWAVLPLTWFAGASVGQQMTVATLVTGMIGAGGFMLSPLPYASLTYIAIFSLSALGALWRSGDASYLGVALLVGLYSPMVAVGSLSAWRKATTLLRAQDRSAQQEQMLAVLLQDFEQHAGEALWETGMDGRLKHVSPRLGELLELDGPALLSEPFLTLVERRCTDGAPALRQALDSGRPFRGLQLSLGHGQRTVHLAINGKRLSDDSGQTLGWRGVIADLTDKIDGERLLRKLAHTDSLTGLANRFMLRDSLAQAVQHGRPVALLSIDLDHFKTINDSHGHSAGDEVLKAVALRLQDCVRPGDMVARLGGDEFAVVLFDPRGTRDVEALAQRLIDALSEPVQTSARRLHVGASVGATTCEGGSVGVDDMLVQSDMALYAAKAAGRGRYALYAAELGELSRRRLAIEHGLRTAIERGELALHWQPKLDIALWKVTGAEALMRWTHPALGRVNPTEFIAVAERSGLIDELGRWALDQACRAGTAELAGLTISVNVSPLQLRDGAFVTHVRDALRQSGLEPGRLELEITESVFMDDADGAFEKLHALRGLGVRIALDDFGTGFSSLSYLRRFPFDTLKIDRAFVTEVLLRNDARAIVRMIAGLADTLGMRTVCEGVETPAQLSAVSEAGCHEMQGYLVSPPRPVDEFVVLRAGWGERPASGTALH